MTADHPQSVMEALLPKRPARGRGDFLVSASNRAALALIDGWRDWPERRLALVGPEGSGKTHLAHVWIEAAEAEKIAAAGLSADDAPALVAAGAVAVEDADRVAGDREREAALFHLLNLAQAEGCALLVTGRAAPSDWPIATPDLASRLSALAAATLAAPDDALLRDLFVKHFADRRLRVGESPIAFLVKRIDRSAAAVAATVDLLDRAALAQGRAITRSFAKDVTGL